MDSSRLAEALVSFLYTASSIATQSQRNFTLQSKPDSTLVTSVEFKIAEYARQFFNFSGLSNSLVLEDSKITAHPMQERLTQEFLVIIDNIDGTHRYASQADDWTISAGILKQGKPWIGGIIDPVRNELIYNDGVNSNIKLRRKGRQSTISLACHKKRFTPEFSDAGTLFQWNSQLSMCPMARATCRSLMNIVLGNSMGYACRNHIWDIAGAWPLLKISGFDLFRQDGSLVSEVSSNDFDEQWLMKNIMYFASEHGKNLIVKNPPPLK